MRIGIVDGYSTSRHLVRELREHGVECVHVRSQETPPSVYSRSFDSSLYLADLGWTMDDAVAARRIRHFGVDQIVPGTESGVALADALNARLGLPGNRIGLSSARRDKAAMATTLRSAGLDAPKGATVQSPNEAADWFAQWPIQSAVVKPQSSAGTDNVRICHSAQECADACESVLGARDFFGNPNKAALIQEYVDGPEYMINTVSQGGVHKVVEIIYSGKLSGPDGAPIYDYMEPVSANSPSASKLIPYVKSVLSALGIDNGAAHNEVRLSQRGPVLIETGARLGGATIPNVIKKHCGTSQMHMLSLSLLGGGGFASFDEQSVSWSGALRCVSLISHVDGVSPQAKWQGVLRALRTFEDMATRVSAGDVVRRTVDLGSSPGFVYLASEDRGEVEQDYARVRSLETPDFYLT